MFTWVSQGGEQTKDMQTDLELLQQLMDLEQLLQLREELDELIEMRQELALCLVCCMHASHLEERVSR